MFNPFPVLVLLTGYILCLLQLARWAERRAEQGRPVTDNAYIYSITIATYCTSWTYYGSVGKVVDSGLLFLTIYIGPTLSIALWWSIVRKLVQIKSNYHISSIADILAARYGKSHRIGAMATIMAFVGSVPYIALQIKSVISSFTLLVSTGPDATPLAIGPIVVSLMIAYTILLGVRRMDPTDRHPGMLAALTAESCIKLVALVSVGLFAIFTINNGLESLLAGLPQPTHEKLMSLAGDAHAPYVTWASYLILAMSAIIFLPHQFHLAVVENSSPRHILTASWLLPIYLFLINLFVVPIAAAGLKAGLDPAQADTFVLGLPMHHGNTFMALLVFIGGFSAAMGMVMVSSVTNAVMLTNHMVLPVIERLPSLKFLKRRLLQCRWAAVAFLILVSYWFELAVGESYILVNIGIIAFGAVLQFAPAILGGIFWTGGTRAGATTGLGLGFILWLHTMLLPALAKIGGVWGTPMRDGLFGLCWLKPEALFGLTSLDPVSHAVFWTMLFNIGGYVLVSYLTKHSPEELSVLRDFAGAPALRDRIEGHAGEEEVNLIEKCALMERTLAEYLPLREARDLLRSSMNALNLLGASRVSVTTLAELYAEVEKGLSGVVGAAAAHRALGKAGVFSVDETRVLSEVYGGILAEMRITPDDLVRRIDYHVERERLLTRHAEELKDTIRLREQEIAERRRIESALRQAEENYRSIFLNAPEGIFQSSVEGRFISANPAMARILGYASAEELVEQVTDIPRQVYAFPLTRTRLLKAIEKNGVVDGMELAITRKNGNVIWCSIIARGLHDAEGRLTGLEGMLADVTERKRAVEELRESEARIRALFNATSDSVILMDLEGTIIAINEHGAKRRGMSPEELVGHVVFEHLPTHVAETRRMHIQDAVLTRSPRTVEEQRGEFYYSITIYPVLDAQGMPQQLASFSRDITHFKKSEETIRLLNEGLERRVQERTRQLEEANHELKDTLGKLTTAHKQLVESEKMASLGGLVAGVAHEINTPVGIGVTAASHLEAQTRTVIEEYRAGGLKRTSLEGFLTVCDESTRMILSNLKRASDLIRSFKQVAVDRSTEEKRAFKLRTFLDEVMLSLRPHLKKTEHTVQIVCDPELTMDSYPGALSQIVTNLVMNSLVHAFEPGFAGHIRISAALDGNRVTFIYSDDGKGIPPEHLDKIFEPFYTTMRGRGGTGLGLHILYNLVTQKLHGSVQCQSTTGQGTTFTLSLPQQS